MADKRTVILEAATTSIAHRGIRGLRIEDVAQEADVAMSLIYYHFRSRNGLIEATLERANERVGSKLRAAAAGTQSGRDLLELLLISDFDEGDVEIRRLAIVWGEATASAVFDDKLRELVQDATNAWIAIVASTVQQGIDDGSIDSRINPRTVARRLTALVLGLTARWLCNIDSSAEVRRMLSQAVAVELNAQSVVV